jgi:hypothetical protein
MNQCTAGANAQSTIIPPPQCYSFQEIIFVITSRDMAQQAVCSFHWTWFY